MTNCLGRLPNLFLKSWLLASRQPGAKEASARRRYYPHNSGLNRAQLESRLFSSCVNPFTQLSRPVIFLLGDSLTQFGYGVPPPLDKVADPQVGWASLVSRDYQRRADVWNRGFSGYNSRHILNLLQQKLEEEQNQPAATADGVPTEFIRPSFLWKSLWLGANDAATPGTRQHVPIDEYQSNAFNIIQHIHGSNDDSPLLLLTPPPVDEEAWSQAKNLGVSDRRNSLARAYYGQWIYQVAEAMHDDNITVVDTWKWLQGD